MRIVIALLSLVVTFSFGALAEMPKDPTCRARLKAFGMCKAGRTPEKDCGRFLQEYDEDANCQPPLSPEQKQQLPRQ